MVLSSNEEWAGKKQKEEVYSEIWGNFIWGGWACENQVGLSMYDGHMETVEHMCMSIKCMLDCIIGFYHKTAEMHFLGIKLIN